PVRGPERPRERLFLARAVTLDARDLGPQRTDVGPRPRDTHLEPGDLRLLVGQALVDLLELGEQRGLARARGRRLLALFLEALLGLLELLLLVLKGVVALGLRAQRDRDRDQQGEQHEDNGEGPGHRAHDFARASQPPRPPISAPASIRATRFAGDRKARLPRPSVRLTSGSRLGATTACVATSAVSARTAPINPCIVPCRRSGSRIVVSLAPTRRMISVSCRRAWRISVVAVVTVRNAATASTAPIPSPMVVRSRCHCESRSTQSALPATSSASGSDERRSRSARALTATRPARRRSRTASPIRNPSTPSALVFHDPSALERDRPSPERAREVGLVRGEHDRRATRPDVPEHGEDLVLHRLVEVPRRLVGEEERRPAHDRARERRALRLALRELSRVRLSARREAHDAERVERALGDLALGRPQHTENEGDVLVD